VVRRPRRRRVPRTPVMREGELLFFDSMVVNFAASGHNVAVETVLESEHVQCLLPHSVCTEASRPESPAGVRAAVSRFLYSLRVSLTQPERADMQRFVAAHRGDTSPQNIDDDLSHVWETAKYGGRFFVTTDRRLLKRADAVFAYKGVMLVTPERAAELHSVMISNNNEVLGANWA
jgi:hypothetical protein